MNARAFGRCGLALALSSSFPVFFAVGCGGLAASDAELPDALIAIHYRTPAQARRRAEALSAEAEGRLRRERQQLRSAHRNAVVPHVEQLSDWLGGAPGEGADEWGRLALLAPHGDAVRVVEGARPGSIPLDWSPDRSRLLFVQPEGMGFRLWELRVADGRTQPVGRAPGLQIQGCYAGGGRLVVVSTFREDGIVSSRIEVSSPGARAPFRALSDGPADHSPSCAPDGGSVVWVSEVTPGRPELWGRDLTPEGSPRRLGPGRDPVHTPDSAWVFLVAPAGHDWQLVRMPAGGGGRVRLPTGHLDPGRPAVSPDGRYVVYVASEEFPRRHLYLRRFDGTGDRVLFADGDADHPVW